MPKTRYGVPYWLDRFPKSRLPSYPRHGGALDLEVAIVGGGLTGCATAYTFAAAGIRVGLFEADRIGRGGTAQDPGVIGQQPAVDFQELAKLHGLRAARRLYRAARRGALDGAATLRRLRIRCGLEPVDAIYFTVRASDERRFRREYDLRRQIGVESSWLRERDLLRDAAVEAHCGLRSRGDAQIDPFRACLGLAAAATARGAQIFERSAVRRARPGRQAVEIATVNGNARAASVVIATGEPTVLFSPLRRHFKRLSRYFVLTEPLPAAVRRELGKRDAALGDADAPPHVLRWMGDDRILFGGADQREVPPRVRAKALVQRTGQLMYELSRLYPAISGIQPEYGWDGLIGLTADGLPYLGPHRNYPRHLFALGYGRTGLGLAFLASRLLLRHHVGEPEKGDELFAFTRTIA